MNKASALIDCLGGTAAVASLLGIKPPSVSAWRGAGIGRARVAELVIATGREAKSLRDLESDRWHLIWPELPETEDVK